MNKLLLASTLSLLAFPVYADSIHINQGGSPSPVTSTSKATSRATSSASARSASHSTAQASGGQGVGIGGTASATGGMGGQGFGGSASASGSGGSSDSHDRVIIAPGLAGLTGTTCMGSTTASVGFAGFGGGLGTTWEDKECTLRENIKIVAQFDGLVARQMLTGLSGVKEAYDTVYNQGFGASTAAQMAHKRPSWCEGRDLATASAYDREACK